MEKDRNTYDEKAERADKGTDDQWLAAADLVEPHPRNETKYPIGHCQTSGELQGEFVAAAEIDCEDMREIVHLRRISVSTRFEL